jgi:CheY-like chemotaxis protein/phosphoribosyl 1,2-cyclic phosphodiesterase
MRYGGNTPCVEVHTADEQLVVLDCGTGAQGLGQALLTAGSGPVRGHLLLTHMHWDHIQGLPFFAPLFAPGNEWDIYGPGSPGQSLQAVLEGQMAYPYFPIALQQFGATIRYHTLVERAFRIGTLRVIPRYLNHPALTLGYRLETGRVTVVYATDHEPHAPYQPEVADQARVGGAVWLAHREEQAHIAFLAGADLVIHDAQYSLAEYQQRLGWGHSPVEYVVDVALAAQAKRLALFHHEPWHDDETLERLVETCRQRVTACAGALHVFAAAEGQVLNFPERPRRTSPRVNDPAFPAEPAAILMAAPAHKVLIVDDAPQEVDQLTDALQSEGLRVLTASHGEAALRLARTEYPALILLHGDLAGGDGLAVCRALRAEADPRLRDLPVVLLASQTEGEHIAAGFAAGVTDYLPMPCKPTYVRSRVCGWLLRTRQEAMAGEGLRPAPTPSRQGDQGH